MGDLLGTEINLDDPFFGFTADDTLIASQLAEVALNTPPASLDAFPEYGFELQGLLLAPATPTQIAMIPLEIRGALEQEPAFTSADVVVQQQSQGPGPTVTQSVAATITVASGDAIGFTVPT
jgi:phage baseplate assembly protein W